MIEMVICPKCGALNPPTIVFCYKCAIPLNPIVDSSVTRVLLRRVLRIYENLDHEKKMKMLCGMLVTLEGLVLDKEELKTQEIEDK